MLLNLSVFIWYGAVCPWVSFRVNDVIPIYRLIFLGVLILLFRRIPVVLAMHKYIPEIEYFQQAAFVGFFGPIGVSAIFYLYVSLDFLNNVTVDGTPDGAVREDAKRLQDVMRVVIWFLAICSIVVHGLSVPLGKLGYNLPRTMSGAFTPTSEASEIDEPDMSLHVRERILHTRSLQSGRSRQRRAPNEPPQNAIFRVGGSVVKPRQLSDVAASNDDEPDRPIKFIGDNSEAQSPGNTPQNVKSQSVEAIRTRQENSAVLRRTKSAAGTSSDDTAIPSHGEGAGSVAEADERDRRYDLGANNGKERGSSGPA
jgi:sodium/hydrogen antiporter